ncbi:hypothetical protein [Sansalvadorimonas verongulae]|uniref:hypothetical protein n=1 Tax=Sansalvadorimonas verongulae TaxID=2172824 RepID=UPI0012BC55DF|nr:hypothetical protein [Sansalvadorimonas verongulae]MTI12633.1 hypothetical protein [Sansalvadorimonas verongulae]
MLIEQELAKALRPLVNDRAYPVVLPQKCKHPAITFHRLNGGWKTGQINGLLKLIDVTGYQSEFQVVVWSPKYSEASMLLQPVVSAVEAIDGLELDSAVDGYDDELGKKIYSKIIEFTAWDDVRTTVCPPDSQTGNNPLGDVSDAIVAELKSHFASTVPLIDLYENQQMKQSVDLPALLVEPVVMGEGESRGDGSYPYAVQFTVYCLVSTSSQQRIGAQWLATQVAKAAQWNHWGLKRQVNHPEPASIESYTLRPGCNGFECWSVQWQQTVYFEEPVEPFKIPEKLYASKSPEIGKAHAPEYQQLTGFDNEP